MRCCVRVCSRPVIGSGVAVAGYLVLRPYNGCLQLRSSIAENRPLTLKLEIECPELKVTRLMRAIDLVDVKVRVLIVELLDPRRQEYGRPLRGRRLRLNPADTLLRQRLGRVHGDLVARQRLAVHPEDVRHATEVHPRRQRLEHFLAFARLQAEVGLAALDAHLEEVDPFLVPEPNLVDRDPLQHRRRRLQELHGGKWGAVHQLFREREQEPVRFGVDLPKRPRCLREERERLPALPSCQLACEGEKPPPLRRMHMCEQRRPLLEVRPSVRPACRGQRLRELEESAPVFAAERLENVRRDAEAVRRKVIRPVAQRIHEAHQYAALFQRHAREERRAALEKLYRERGRAPGALVEQASEVHPIAEPDEGDRR